MHNGWESPLPKKPKVEVELQQTSQSQMLQDPEVARRLDSMQERIQKMINKTKLMSDTPNYQLLRKEYARRYGTFITTLIISGPKGCGKTSALLLLYKELILANVNTLYVDLSKFQSTQSQKALISLIDHRNIDTLLIDNVQLHDVQSGVFEATFVVAALSPGGEVNKKVSEFGKSRGDNDWMQVFFTPFNLEASRKLLTFYGVAIEDKRISDMVIEGKKIKHEEVSESPYYITPQSPRVTRSMKKKVLKRIRVETNAESVDFAVEQGKNEEVTGEAAVAVGGGLIDSLNTTQMSTSGSTQSANVTLEQAVGGAAMAFGNDLVGSLITTERSTKVPMIAISKLTWEKFVEIFYFTGGVARYLHRYVYNGNHNQMNSELGRQMQHFVQHYSM